MVLLLFFAFLSGLVTILAPCIWPLLPIILSATFGSKSHHRPLGLTLGIMVSFAVITLTISSLVKLFHFDPNVLRLLAVVVIGFLGLTMIIPALSKITEGFVSRLSGIFGSKVQQGSGFGPGFITGLSVGIVWSPCAGPILAAIAALAATGKVTGSVILVTIAYVMGVGIPLFIFAISGQTIFNKVKFISSHTGRIQQVFGVIMLLTALAIYTNYDTYLQAQLLNKFPQFSSALNGFESQNVVSQQLNVLKGNNSQTPKIDTMALFNTNYPAPDFVGITKWLNTEKPLTIANLKGKVVLVDFWTYTCINCIRTLPFVTSWYDKYKDQGFVVVGVHTPEFAFEHETTNVLNAIKMYKIHYPVAQDNDYSTWNNFNNQYWPAEYLIDANGNVRRTHFGEGEYDQTEMAIQALLKEAGHNIQSKLDNMPDQTPTTQLSPETYLNSDRMQYYYPGGNAGSADNENFMLSDKIPVNSFSLGGYWTIDANSATSGQDGVLTYHFYANKVFLVLSPGSNTNPKIKVMLDGKILNSSNSGSDVSNSMVTVDSDRLFNLIDLKGNIGEHTLRLEFQTPGIQAFAFTFG